MTGGRAGGRGLAARVPTTSRATRRTWWSGRCTGLRRDGGAAPGAPAHLHNAIPHARGLGSSSAAIVGGIALARGLVAGGTLLLDDDAAFRLAARLEGHPDNVAPGLVRRLRGERARRRRRLLGGPVLGRPAGLGASRSCRRRGSRPRRPGGCCRPRCPTPTPRPTPVGPRCWSRPSPGGPSTCFLATRDLLHQDYRRPAMPASLDLVEALRAGGIAAVVSGAGPTVLALCADCDVDALVGRAPEAGGRCHLDARPGRRAPGDLTAPAGRATCRGARCYPVGCADISAYTCQGQLAVPDISSQTSSRLRV